MPRGASLNESRNDETMSESESKTEEMEHREDVEAAADGSAGAEVDAGEEADGQAAGEGEDIGTLDEELAAERDVLSSAEADLAAVRDELGALNDRHLRLAAEFNNYRRRVEQERLESWTRAQAELVGKLLDALDDLQRVAQLDLTNATVEAIMEGVDLVERKFMRALEDSGVEVIDPDGDRFNPETMEAMMRVPAESEEEDEQVDRVLQKGYALKGQLVRPARVSVRKKD